MGLQPPNAEFAVSNPAETMDVRLLCLFCVVLRRADHSFRGVPPSVCVYVWVGGWLRPELGHCSTEKKKLYCV